MDFARFTDLLDKKSLFFVRPTLFSDPWEGYPTKPHFEASGYDATVPESIREKLIEMSKTATPSLVRESMAVSCWHIGEHESEAFWRSYPDRGVAIQSTFGKLKESFHSEDEWAVLIGQIEYKDHQFDRVDQGNIFKQIMWKRKSFEYENELRAVIWNKAVHAGKPPKDFENIFGQHIKTDLSVLIENIYTTPFENGDWFNQLVNDTLKRYGYEVSCQKSSLMDRPV